MADFQLSPFEPTGNLALLELEAEEPSAIAARENEIASVVAALVRASGSASALESESASIVAHVVVHTSATAVADEGIAEPDVTIYVEQGVIAVGDEVASVEEPSVQPSEVHAIGDESVSIRATVRVRAILSASEDQLAAVDAAVRVAGQVTAIEDAAAIVDSVVRVHSQVSAVEDESVTTAGGGIAPSEAVDVVEDETASVVAALVRAHSSVAAHQGESASIRAVVRVAASVAAHESEDAAVTPRVLVAVVIQAVENEVVTTDAPDEPATPTGGVHFRITGSELVEMHIVGGPVVTFRIRTGPMRWKARNANTLIVEDARNNLLKGRPVITGATVTAIIVDSDGAQIDGVEQPITLTAIDGHENWYAAAIPASADLTTGQRVTAQVTFTGPGDNEDGYREETITVEAP